MKKFVVVVAALTIVAVIGIAYGVHEKDLSDRQQRYASCKANADAVYNQNWARACRAETPASYTNYDSNCTLSSGMGGALTSRHDADYQQCLTEAQNGL